MICLYKTATIALLFAPQATDCWFAVTGGQGTRSGDARLPMEGSVVESGYNYPVQGRLHTLPADRLQADLIVF